jgi:hypothetical protein
MGHKEVNQSSGNTEYYTPVELVALARRVLGHFDLDPASCELANQEIKATTIYTIHNDGLTKPWAGKVFMNHPFHKGEKACAISKVTGNSLCKKKNCRPNEFNTTRGHHITEDIPSNLQWITKLDEEYRNGNVTEAICITFSSMSETWMIPLLNQLQCFPRGRIQYRRPDGTTDGSATKGSLITYFGDNKRLFEQVFGEIGTVK